MAAQQQQQEQQNPGSSTTHRPLILSPLTSPANGGATLAQPAMGRMMSNRSEDPTSAVQTTMSGQLLDTMLWRELRCYVEKAIDMIGAGMASNEAETMRDMMIALLKIGTDLVR